MTLPAPYYQDESVTIYHGDCRDILPELPKVDLVLTDPPYGIAHPTDYADRGRSKLANCRNYPPVYGDDQPFDPSAWLALGTGLILWGANHYASRLPDSDGWLVWDKERPETLDQSTCEMAWTNCVHGVRIFHWLWHGMMRRGDEPLVHPTQKPVALFKWCLQWPKDAQTILDPFMGSGTTLVAAQSLGRKSIGIEIEEKYCRIAVERLRQKPLPLTEPASHDRLTVQGGLFDGTSTIRRDKAQNLRCEQGPDSDRRGEAEAQRDPQAALSRGKADNSVEGNEG